MVVVVVVCVGSGGVCVCVCVQYVCVKCMCNVRLCACTCVCVCPVRVVYFSLVSFLVHTCMFLPFFFLICVYELTSCAFTFIQVITSSSSSFHFSSVFISMHVHAVSFFFSFYCLHALNKLFNSYFICFEYVWIFLLLLLYFFVLCACVLSVG